MVIIYYVVGAIITICISLFTCRNIIGEWKDDEPGLAIFLLTGMVFWPITIIWIGIIGILVKMGEVSERNRKSSP